MLKREKVYTEKEIIRALESLRRYTGQSRIGDNIIDLAVKTIQAGGTGTTKMEPFDVDRSLRDSIEELKEEINYIETEGIPSMTSLARVQAYQSAIRVLEKRLTKK